MKQSKVKDYGIGVEMIVLPIAWQLDVADLPGSSSTEYHNCLGFIRNNFQFIHHLLGIHVPLFNIIAGEIIHTFYMLHHMIYIGLVLPMH